MSQHKNVYRNFLETNIGADAVLMGEVLMRAPDKTALLREMRHAGLNQ